MNYASDGERHLEKSEYPVSNFQIILSLGFILISFIIFFMRIRENIAQGLTAMALGCLLFSLALGVPQITRFTKIGKAVLEEGRYLIEGESSRGWVLLFLFFIVALIGPFFLSGILSPSAWLGSVLGMIVGFSISQLSMIYLVERWEKENELELEGFRVWVYDERNRVTVIERGVMKKS